MNLLIGLVANDAGRCQALREVEPLLRVRNLDVVLRLPSPAACL